VEMKEEEIENHGVPTKSGKWSAVVVVTHQVSDRTETGKGSMRGSLSHPPPTHSGTTPSKAAGSREGRKARTIRLRKTPT